MAHLMSRLFKLQFLGPFTLFAATLCAELAARALQYAPGSELLWFINLRMFGIFQRSYAMLLNLSEVVPIDGFQYFGLALPIFVFVLACVGLAAKSRLPLTVATHLSVVYASFLVLSWQAGVPTVTQASLAPIAVPSDARAGSPTRHGGLKDRSLPSQGNFRKNRKTALLKTALFMKPAVEMEAAHRGPRTKRSNSRLRCAPDPARCYALPAPLGALFAQGQHVAGYGRQADYRL